MSPDLTHEQMVKTNLPEGSFRAADIVTTKRPEAADIGDFRGSLDEGGRT